MKKHLFIKKLLVLLVVLITCVPQMWAAHKANHCGFWDNGGIDLNWTLNGSSRKTVLNYNGIDGTYTGTLGTVTTSLTLSSTVVHVWRDYAYGNVCSSTIYWELYKGDTKIDNGNYSPASWGSWDGSNNTMTYSTSQDFLAKTTGPANYTLRVYAKITGQNSDVKYGDPSYLGCGTEWWYNNNTSNGYYSITFTIPSKNLTVAGAANGNTVSGSVTGVTKGTAYTITATPTAGYAFNGWSKTSGGSSITIADAASPTTTVTFNNYSNDATVTASFVVEETHDVAVSYKCGSMTIKTGTTESGVGVTSTRSVTAPAINDHTFSSWTKGSDIVNRSANLTTNPIVINTAVGAAAANCTLTANYTLVACSLCVGTSATFSAPGTKYLMSYDADEDAYYYDMASSPANLYFRFLHATDSKIWSGNWNTYPNVFNVDANGSKIDCGTNVKDWGEKASLHFSGLTGSPIRIWFDFQNKKAWITETTYTVNLTSENTNKGTVDPSSVTAGKNTASETFTATPKFGYKFKQWSVTSPASLVSSVTTNPNTVKATGSSGAVQAQFDYRWVLRGSINSSDDQHGMPGWSTVIDYFTGISAGGKTGTITVNLEAHTKYKFKVYDLVDGAYYSKASVDWTGSNNVNTEKNVSPAITFTTTASGPYTFTFNFDTKNVAIAYPTSYVINFSAETFVNGGESHSTSTTGGTVAAVDGYSISLTSGWQVKAGGSVEITATKKTGYTFEGFYTNAACTTAVSGADVSISDNVLTFSGVSAAKTVFAKFSENMTTVTLVASPASKGTFTIGGAAAISTTAGVTTTRSVTAVPVDGYRVNTSATVWSSNNANITLNDVKANPVTVTGAGSGGTSTLTATFTPNNYTITLNDNEGSGGVGSATVTFDDDNFAFASSFVAPTRTGYIFQGYYTASSMMDGDQLIDKDGNWHSDKEPYVYINGDGNWIHPDNMTLYAGWTPITYTVTYHANGGSAKSEHTDPTVTNWTYDVSQYLEVPTTHFDEPNGYTVYSTYWNDSPNGDGTDYAWASVRNLTSTDGGNIDLYAQWYRHFNIEANYDDGVDGFFRVHYNTAIVEDGATTLFPTRLGYLADGYYTAAEGGNKVLNANGTVVSGTVTDWVTAGKWVYTGAQSTFYAHWNQIHYNLAFNGNDCSAYVGEATGSKASLAGVAYEDEVDITVGTFAREGYTFAGWSKTACATTASYIGDTWHHISYTDGDNVTLYAVWRPNTYTISFNGQGAYSVDETSRPIRMGDNYGTRDGYTSSLPTAYKVGYEFMGWYTRPNGAGTHVTDETQMTTASDHTLYAYWAKAARVYFKNTLGWTNVYVTWDAEWNRGGQDKGAGAYGKTQEPMSNIYGTDIWYKDIPASILSSWKGNIAFTNKAMDNYEWFDEGQAVYRRDFDSDATMFVPTPNDPNKYIKNKHNEKPGTVYYSTDMEVDEDGEKKITNYRYKNGYWVRYEELQSGYTVKGSWAWDDDHYVERHSLNDSTYVFTIRNLAANTDYWFNLYKHCTTSNNYSSVFKPEADMTSASAENVVFSAQYAEGADKKMHTTVAGDYTFKFVFSALGEIRLTIEYPLAVNDYRVVYGWNDGSAQTFSSEYIKAKADAVDTISMFIHSGDNATDRSLYIQKCTGMTDGVPTWDDDYSAIALPTETASGKTSGVYNFRIAQNGSAAATGESIGKYEGNFYIRTDSAAGGWDFYKEYADNLMTYSEYSMTQTLSDPYSHYYCKYIGTTTTDISYTVATDYSPAICPVMTGDATIGMGNKTLYDGKPASVRFTYNEETNETFRAYLKSAQGAGNTRFLLIHGKTDDMIFNSAGAIIADSTAVNGLKENELLFKDTENWVYELAIKAKPGAQVSIIAQYNGIDRYLVGDVDSYETIIDGKTSTTKYNIAAVYDFKTNRLITTWIPDGTISEDITEVDVMIERQYQGGGTTITFGKASEEAKAGTISAKRVIGALKFDYNDLVGKVANWTPDTRAKMMFFISFPFDVNVSDIFGLNSSYGQAYIVQKYNGALRAEKGFFLGDGTTSFWEILPVDSVMHANVGYVVTMDNDYLNGDVGHVWDNKKLGDHVYLYFPSANDPKEPIVISSDPQTIKIPAHECKINRTFGNLNHKYTDSNWNLMGVPIFQNHTGSDTEGTPGAIFTASEEPSDTTYYKEHPDLGYFYQWGTDKNYTIRSAVGFTFLPMHCYMVQYAGDVKFTCAEPSVVPASVAPRRTPMTENYNIELQVLNSNDEMLNHTYVELRENAVDTFAVNEDTYMMSNSKAVNVYTFAGAYDVAANVLSIDSHVVPVGVIVNQAGTYTFSMPSNFSGNVTLVDNVTGIHTNLALSDYTVDLTTGTNDNRFYLEIDINKTPTSIDVIEEGGSLKDGKAHKFIENGLMYILKDGVVYDARGNRVK